MSRWIERGRHRSLEQCRRSSEAARGRARLAECSSASAMSSSGPGEPSGAVPRASIGIDVRISRFRKRAMRGLPVCKRRRPVRRGAHERMAKHHPRADLEESGLDRRRRVLRAGAERDRGGPHDHRITDRLGRGHGEEALRERRKVGEPATETLFDLSRQRQGRRQAQPVREARLASSPAATPPARAGCRASRQRSGAVHVRRVESGSPRSSSVCALPCTEPFDVQLGEPREISVRFARGEHQSNPVREDPPRQRTRAPVQTRDRAIVRRRRHTTAESSSDAAANTFKIASPIRSRSGDVPEVNPKAVLAASRCGSGSDLETMHHRRAQLVERGEREFHLGLHTRRVHHRVSRCGGDEMLQERGLANARVAPHHECSTPPDTDIVEQLVERAALLLAARSVQRTSSIRAGRDHRRWVERYWQQRREVSDSTPNRSLSPHSHETSGTRRGAPRRRAAVAPRPRSGRPRRLR